MALAWHYASMQPATESPAASPKRRTVLAVLGAGVCATVGAVFFWRPGSSVQVKPSSTTPPPVPKWKTEPLPEPVAAGSDGQSSGPGQPMTRAWFLPYLHTQFQMHAEVLSMTAVELIEVSPAIAIKDTDHHINYTSFSLVFKGALGMPKESQIYHLDHEKLGKMDLFLSPIGRYKDQVRYEAVFSQRV
jgi:hypothetical protein